MKSRSGFTIIELMVVIVISALLLTIATISLANMQKQSRDSRRASNAAILAEALEKYFTQNGEYPSTPKISGANGSSIQTLLGLVNNNSLIAPGASNGTTNSWGTGTPSMTNQMTYTGKTDTSASCKTGTMPTDACADFVIQYFNEQDGTPITLNSRHASSTLATATPDAPANAPTITTSYTAPNLTATASTIGCPAGGSPKWAFQYRTNDGAWGSWGSWAASANYVIPNPAEGAKYGIQAKQQCFGGGAASTDSPTSNESTYVQPISTVASTPAPYILQPLVPYGNTTSVCMDAYQSGGAGSAIQMWSCVSGSANQLWAWNSNDGTLRPSYDLTLCATSTGHGSQMTVQTCDGTALRKFSQSASAQYIAAANGWCIDDANWGTTNGTSIGTWDCNGGTAQSWNPASTQVTWQWPAATGCPATASTIQYQFNYQTSGGIADSGWIAPTTATTTPRTVSKGYTYNTQIQARCTSPYYNGPWSATGQANIIVGS